MPNYRIQYRRDTAENWQTVNPILLDGEVGYEITDQEGVLLTKVGNGVMGADGTITGTHWNDLPYVSGPIGPAPEHEWQETSLRFRKPNGVWGDYVNLQGPQGIQGIQGEPGEPGTNIPATRESLGGIIVGDALDITAEGCLYNIAPGWNDQIIITESGDFTVPYDGIYETTIINGGDGGRWWKLHDSCYPVTGGKGGDRITRLLHLEKNAVIPVTIGAGGLGVANNSTSTAYPGGITSFGTHTGSDAGCIKYPYNCELTETHSTALHIAQGFGTGPGGGNTEHGFGTGPGTDNADSLADAQWYGGGGGAFTVMRSNALYSTGAGNGGNGVVILRFFNPEKASLPFGGNTDTASL